MNRRTFLKLVAGAIITPYVVQANIPEYKSGPDGYLKVYIKTSDGEFVYEAPYTMEIKENVIKLLSIEDLVIHPKKEIYVRSISVSIPDDFKPYTHRKKLLLWDGFTPVSADSSLTIEWETNGIMEIAI